MHLDGEARRFVHHKPIVSMIDIHIVIAHESLHASYSGTVIRTRCAKEVLQDFTFAPTHPLPYFVEEQRQLRVDQLLIMLGKV